jgi:hypothetical protein
VRYTLDDTSIEGRYRDILFCEEQIMAIFGAVGKVTSIHTFESPKPKKVKPRNPHFKYFLPLLRQDNPKCLGKCIYAKDLITTVTEQHRGNTSRYLWEARIPKADTVELWIDRYREGCFEHIS